LSNDADPKFLAEFYKNLKILSQDLYKKSVVAQTNFSTSTIRSSIGGGLLAATAKRTRRPSMVGGDDGHLLASLALGGDDANSQSAAAPQTGTDSGHPPDYFSNDSLFERMKQYAQQGGIPMEYLERYAAAKQS
jgi:hypothetical protein